MIAPLFLLFIALFILVWLGITDKAMRLLAERAGHPYNARGARSAQVIVGLVIVLIAGYMLAPRIWREPPPPMLATYGPDSLWMGMDSTLIEYIGGDREDLVAYGRELIRNTAFYLGPQGTVSQHTNGMNCQNCHLEAGTKPWGNNYSAVWSTYPKFRERSGGNETVMKRINDCVERSLNGTALDSTSLEMRSLLAYMEWLGTGVPKNKKPKGVGLAELKFMERAADPVHGEVIYTAKCMRCHLPDGSGQKLPNATTYLYPPLWGKHSYNIGAGLYRLSRFAGYVKNNMPQGVSWEKPELTDEEAWDLAAYVNSRQRPDRDLSKDWPKTAGKPADHPFGPYADAFTEEQHKFGPFGPIAEAKAATAKPK